jgi:putative membrane protein
MLRVVGRYGMMNGFRPWGGIIMGIFLLILILVAIYVYRKNNDTSSSALELLKMKFVKGEITEEEYINKKNTLLKK